MARDQLWFEITANTKVLEKWFDLSGRVKRRLAIGMEEIADLLYEKVHANLTGKILQQKSGELVGSLKKEVFAESGDFYIAFVGIVPETPKAWALEKGGAGDYPIYPNAVTKLSFVSQVLGRKVVVQSVLHPPAKAYGYLLHAFEEVEAEVPNKLTLRGLM